jgi:hypothetical protein
LADNERLKSQFLMAPIGIDPINQTIRTQSVSSVGQASRPVQPPGAHTIRTQSAPVNRRWNEKAGPQRDALSSQ